MVIEDRAQRHPLIASAHAIPTAGAGTDTGSADGTPTVVGTASPDAACPIGVENRADPFEPVTPSPPFHQRPAVHLHAFTISTPRSTTRSAADRGASIRVRTDAAVSSVSTL
ncbi:hypothetical protein GCM10009838_69470 [Catenulispora subtropica]|uniref:Uncharacterized protein n=1 Tax=Catenulispora subtropica TaxID=450798 RepID=A0ABN2SYX6_9ACTN